jgi:hypothetical protein
MTSAFAFKGNRDYLHSTSVFDWIVADVAPNARDIDFVFNRKTSNRCTVTAGTPAVGERVVGRWHDRQRGLRIVDTGERILERIPYDEDGISKACILERDQVLVPTGAGGASFIERLVAAYKSLLLYRAHPQVPRFAFVRLRLQYIPSTDFLVCYCRTLGEFHQGGVIANGVKMGEIYFGKW